MGRVVVITNLSLDGVMQSPGRPDEDTRGGFERGGWAAPYAAMQQSGDALADMGALPLGRWTYTSFQACFPSHPENPFAGFPTDVPKYVASTTLAARLPWISSTLLTGDAAQAVARLKGQQEKDLVVFGVVARYRPAEGTPAS